ncbi:MAG: hypothetical protein NZM09_02905 [Ignavibacterium sp.]|nr:hypothetical protein [Ignavibacterium sp.]MDW8374626.1 hypothetical protein [Ignavibacteriales bacterium]
MGEIVWFSILRFVFIIFLLWFSYDLWGEKYFVLVGFLSIFFFVIYPAIRSYRIFFEKNKTIIESTLCSSCKHFDKSAVLCMKYDKHPSLDFLPCEGNDWEPK